MTTPVFVYAAEYTDPNNQFHARGLLDRGFTLPGNSDNTGANPAAFNPWFSMWCAVTRKNYKGEVIQPEERLTPMEALKMFTNWAAWGSFQEDIKGSIEVGKLADLVILGDNPLICDPDAIKDMPVETVIIGGEIKVKN